MSFWRRPHPTLLRRVLFQVHLWTGIAVGLYVVVVCITGASLIFRIDMQRALHPQLFAPQAQGPLVAPARIIERLERAYPGWRVAGIEAPSDRRPTYLGYVSRDTQFLTLLLDPVTSRVLGELPQDSVIRTLQGLHFDLLGGSTGRTANGVGAALLLVLALTGLVIWWPGAARWTRAVQVDFAQPAVQVNWELHRFTGFWALPFILMWAVTGLYFAFPQGFRATVNAVSPLSTEAPQAAVMHGPAAVPLPHAALLDAAARIAPGRPIARIVLPGTPDATFQVTFASRSPTPSNATLQTIQLDPYTGTQRQTPEARPSAGDVFMRWVVPLHVGGLGGSAIRVVWCVLGLAPALLFVTGVLSWWTRVVRPRRS